MASFGRPERLGCFRIWVARILCFFASIPPLLLILLFFGLMRPEEFYLMLCCWGAPVLFLVSAVLFRSERGKTDGKSQVRFALGGALLCLVIYALFIVFFLNFRSV